MRTILTATGRTITPAGQRLTSLDDLNTLAGETRISCPQEIKTAS